MSFESLGLQAELLRAVHDQGYTTPTPVQRRAIPSILAGSDILAGAQTGTGKTAGFALPLLQRLGATPAGREWRPVRALVLTPTRELAAQVRESMVTYGRHLRLRSAAIYGGVNINPQIKNLGKGIDIVVATPGRLLDHLGQRTLDLDSVEILVLDEADRMLDMGFLPDIRRILSTLPAQRQNLLFSATFDDQIRKLAAGLLNSPEVIQIGGRSSAADGVEHLMHPVDRDRKRPLLAHLIQSGDWKQVLVFAGMKHAAERLARQLTAAGISATSIHGNKSQNQRTRALRDFKSGAARVLVATDVAARGIDIDELHHVVNFDMPVEPETYIHRVGRTGRAGRKGQAVSLVAPEERDILGRIERLLRNPIPSSVVPGFEPVPGASRPVPAARSQRNGNSQPQSFRANGNGSGNGSRRRRPRR